MGQSDFDFAFDFALDLAPKMDIMKKENGMQ